VNSTADSGSENVCRRAFSISRTVNDLSAQHVNRSMVYSYAVPLPDNGPISIL